MKTILVANPKGGSGKTTLSVNIAGYLANRGQHVALLDLDRQQSATRWLALRPGDLPPIRILGSKKEEAQRNDWLVIDSPAALHGKNLAHALKLASKIIVPVAPSLFDLQASRDFLKTLAEEKKVRSSKCHIGVVGMRMEMRTKAAWALESFPRHAGPADTRLSARDPGLRQRRLRGEIPVRPAALPRRTGT